MLYVNLSVVDFFFSSLYPIEKVEKSVLWENIRPVGRGLNNVGNTCFLVL